MHFGKASRLIDRTSELTLRLDDKNLPLSQRPLEQLIKRGALALP